jgi:hypothetical protein
LSIYFCNYPQKYSRRNKNVTEGEFLIYGFYCVKSGFLLRTEGVFKWSFFKVLHTPGHISENSDFEDQNNQGMTTFLRDSAQVYKEPMKFGGTYTSGT